MFAENPIPSAEFSINRLVDTVFQMQKQPIEIGIGLVIVAPPEIEIVYNNIVLNKTDLYVDAFLLKNYTRTTRGAMAQKNERGSVEIPRAKGDIKTSSMSKRGGVGRPSFVSHHHKINNSYRADLEGDYKSESTSEYKNSVIFTDFGIGVGDLVTLLPINGGQKFIIGGKVYYLGDLTAEDFEDKEQW